MYLEILQFDFLFLAVEKSNYFYINQATYVKVVL